jgi:hypothetical protein
MTISGDEHPLYIKLIKDLLKILNDIRLNSKDLKESDLIPIVDKIYGLFGKMQEVIKEEMEEMKGKFYGTCDACGRALGP